MKISNSEQLQSYLVPILQQALGDNLVCAFLQGASAHPEYISGKDPWDLSLFLATLDPKSLPDLTAVHKALEKAKVRLNYLFTPDMALSATDTYPLEFLNLAHQHFILCGYLPIAGFIPVPSVLRLQCERELRGLLIHLHREYVLHAHQPKELRQIFSNTMPRFIPVFNGVYWLINGGQYPSGSASCLRTIDSHWQLGNLFQRVMTPPKDPLELKWLAGEYIVGIEKILKTIDFMEESQ